MIIFNNSSTSPWMTALTLTIIFLCLIISTFLNPTVFLYNKKKTSIAGLLFCIISATDFTICLYWPAVILYYAATIDLDKARCDSEASSPRKPQNCIIAHPSITNLITGVVNIFLNSVILMTTSILTIVRFIQIKFPFYNLRRSRVLFVLVFLGVAQFSLWSFAVLSPDRGNFFLISSVVVATPDPYGIGEERRGLINLLIYMNSVPILAAQAFSLIASACTALTLFKRRNQLNEAHSNLTKIRAFGALKVMLTNISSLIYTIMFCSPLLLIFARAYNYPSVSENDAWTTFWAVNMIPVISSVWNPVVFLCFTPKSRSNFLSLLDKIRLHFRVNPNNASRSSQSSPSTN